MWGSRVRVNKLGGGKVFDSVRIMRKVGVWGIWVMSE